MTRVARLLCCLLAAALAGCGGWHLRGQGTSHLSFSKVYIDQSRSPLVTNSLAYELDHRGMKRVAKRADAEVIIKLEDERFERRILSVDPATGKVREVELVLSTHFTVRTASGKMLMVREPLTWQSDYVFDEGSLLGTVEQDTTIQNDLSKTAATSLAFRLESVKVAPSDLVSPERAAKAAGDSQNR